MGLDQRESENFKSKKDRERKEQNEKTDFFLSQKKILRQSKDLRERLARKISLEFGIDIEKARQLISGEISHSLDALRQNVDTSNTFSAENLQKAINSAIEEIENVSKKYREDLKNILSEDIYSPENHTYTLTKYVFSEDILDKVRNPRNISDQLTGVVIGTIDSAEAIVICSYKLGKGILLSPYHLYIILTKKGSFEEFSKI